MSCNRILARKLHKRQELKREVCTNIIRWMKKDGEWVKVPVYRSIDLRPRDSFGYLQGYCSEKAKKERESNRLPYKGE
jgi:hypothetical protein